MQLYTKEQLNRLLSSIEDYNKTSYLRDRDKIIIKMAYYMGMRRKEVSEARVCFVDRENKAYTVSKFISKNKKNRTIPFPQVFYDELVEYIKRYKLDDFLFLSRKGGHICPMAIEMSFLKYRKLAGLDFIKDLSKRGKKLRTLRFHDLRGTYASTLDKAGVRLRVIQNLLGHTNLSSTDHYLSESTSEEKREAVEKIFTLENDNNNLSLKN